MCSIEGIAPRRGLEGGVGGWVAGGGVLSGRCVGGAGREEGAGVWMGRKGRLRLMVYDRMAREERD